MPRRPGRKDPAVPAKLALRNIEDNLSFTDTEAWAWYVLPTQPWAFRSDTQREQCKPERIRPIADSDRILRTAIGGEFLFELCHVRSAGKCGAIQNF